MSRQEESHGGTASSGGSVSGISAIPWWLRAVVVVGALLMAAGGIIALVHPAMLVSPHDEINGAVHIYAGYLASRNLVLAMMLLATLVLGARLALGNLMVLTGFIQLVDAWTASKGAGQSCRELSCSEWFSSWVRRGFVAMRSGNARLGGRSARRRCGAHAKQVRFPCNFWHKPAN
jgi:hypothetical protein